MQPKLARLPSEEKIRKVSELIRLRQKIKTDISDETKPLPSLMPVKALPSNASARKSVDGLENNFRSASARIAGA